MKMLLWQISTHNSYSIHHSTTYVLIVCLLLFDESSASKFNNQPLTRQATVEISVQQPVGHPDDLTDSSISFTTASSSVSSLETSASPANGLLPIVIDRIDDHVVKTYDQLNLSSDNDQSLSNSRFVSSLQPTPSDYDGANETREAHNKTIIKTPHTADSTHSNYIGISRNDSDKLGKASSGDRTPVPISFGTQTRKPLQSAVFTTRNWRPLSHPPSRQSSSHPGTSGVKSARERTEKFLCVAGTKCGCICQSSIYNRSVAVISGRK